MTVMFYDATPSKVTVTEDWGVANNDGLGVACGYLRALGYHSLVWPQELQPMVDNTATR